MNTKKWTIVSVIIAAVLAGLAMLGIKVGRKAIARKQKELDEQNKREAFMSSGRSGKRQPRPENDSQENDDEDTHSESQEE